MNKKRVLAYISIVFVAATIIAAFFLVGSPARERAMRFDEQRLGDLQNIQSFIPSYYSVKGSLPKTLADLQGFQGFSVPTDPENGQAYEYSVLAANSFRLCATFAFPSQDQAANRASAPAVPAPYPYPAPITSWQHGAGRSCFDLTVEKPASGAIPPITVKAVVP